MASGSIGSSENTVNSNGRPSCKHGYCHLKTSFSLKNPGRRYWKCPLSNQPGGCDYFLWYEEPYEGQVREVLVKIIQKNLYTETKLVRAEKDCSKFLENLQDARDELEAKVKTIQAMKVQKNLLKKSLKQTKFKLGCWIIFTLGCASLMLASKLIQYYHSGGSAAVVYLLK